MPLALKSTVQLFLSQDGKRRSRSCTPRQTIGGPIHTQRTGICQTLSLVVFEMETYMEVCPNSSTDKICKHSHWSTPAYAYPEVSASALTNDRQSCPSGRGRTASKCMSYKNGRADHSNSPCRWCCGDAVSVSAQHQLQGLSTPWQVS